MTTPTTPKKKAKVIWIFGGPVEYMARTQTCVPSTPRLRLYEVTLTLEGAWRRVTVWARDGIVAQQNALKYLSPQDLGLLLRGRVERVA